MRKYIIKTQHTIIIDLIFTTICNIAIAAMPFLAMLLFDFDFASGGGLRFVIIIVAIYIACTLTNTFSQYIAQRTSWKTAINFAIALKKDYFEKATQISQPDFDKKDIGEYVSAINNNVQAITTDYLDPFVENIRSGINIAIYAVFLFVFVDWRIAAVIMLASLLSVLMPMLTGKKLALYRKNHLTALGGYTNLLQNLLNSRWLVNKRTQKAIFNRHEEDLVATEQKHLVFGIQKTLKNVLNGLFTYFLNISAFAAVAILLLRGEITIGVGVATLGYVESFIWPIKYIMDNTISINGSKEARTEMLNFIEQQVPAVECGITDFERDIRFEDVSIIYENFAVKNLNFAFERGKKYAIIGHSGSGKSSLVRALTKAVDINGGRIVIDGRDLHEIDTASLICNVNQAEQLFAADFMDNITVFNSYSAENCDKLTGAVDNKMWAAVTAVEDCLTLSGGEKQVVSIMRSLTINTPILVYDEPFSAVDAKNTKLLKEYLLSLEHKTIIIITHKVSDEELSGFDHIIEMANGRITKAAENFITL